MASVDLVDIAILTLLCGGIGYGWVLSRRLERLRSALVAFGPALEAFCTAVDRSERSVQELRTESGRLSDRPAEKPALPPVPVPTAKPEREALMAAFADILRERRAS